MSLSSKIPDDTHELFHKLYNNYYAKMLRYATAIFNTRGASDLGDGRAEEAVQEAFAYAWVNQDKLFSSPNPEGWLFKVLYYKVLERIRDENKWTRNIQYIEQFWGHQQTDDPYLQADNTDNSLQEIISDEDYTLLTKLYIDGSTYLDICKEYHLTKSALGCRIHRIKKKIRETLLNYFDE